MGSVERSPFGNAASTDGRFGLRLRLLGTPRIELAEGREVVLEPLNAALLALIALDGPTSRERLIALLAPDSERDKAQAALRSRVKRLHDKLGRPLFTPGDEILDLRPGVEHDLHPEAAIAENPPRALLGDLRFDDRAELRKWAVDARQRWDRSCVDLLTESVERLLADERLPEAIALARRATLLAPCSETAHRLLMRLHHLDGDPASARRAFENCVAELDRLLDADPTGPTLALAAAIARGGVAPTFVARSLPIALQRPPRMVGRESALQAFAEGWEAGRIVVVRGEAGIGKSRLVQDFASATGLVRIERVLSNDSRMPYTALVRWLDAWRDTFGAPTGGGVTAALARVLASPDLLPAPGAFDVHALRSAFSSALGEWFDRGFDRLVIEDLQHVDPASLEVLLDALGRRPRQRVAITLRTSEMPAAVGHWLETEVSRDVVEDIRLDLLDPRQIRELLDVIDLPGIDPVDWSVPLARFTGGNPFFILEVLRTSQQRGETTPPTSASLRGRPRLDRLIGQRLATLPKAALRLARVASTIGQDFTGEMAAAVLGVPEVDLSDAWMELERAQVLREGVFAHEALFEAARASVPPALARALHGSIARALEPLGLPSARLAHHWKTAWRWADAARHLELAAHQSLLTARHREALVFWDDAAACHVRAGHASEAFRSRASAVESACLVESAAAVEARTLDLSSTADTDAERLAALVARSRHLGYATRYAEAIAPAREALASARRLHDEPAEFVAAAVLAIAMSATGRYTEGIEILRPSAECFATAADSQALADFASAYGTVLCAAGRPAEAVIWLQRCVDAARRLGITQDTATVIANLAHTYGLLGRFEEAWVAGEAGLSLHRRHGPNTSGPAIVGALMAARAAQRTGRWTEAEDLLVGQLDTARREHPFIAPVLEHQAATLYTELGQPARAYRMLGPLLTDAPAASATALRRSIVVARLEALSGQPNPERIAVLSNTLDRDAGSARNEQLAIMTASAMLLPAPAAIELCRAVRAEAEALGLLALRTAAGARLASALAAVGDLDASLYASRLVISEARSARAHDMDAPEFAWHVHQGLAGRAPDEAFALLRQALVEVERSLPGVPEAYRESYLHRSRYVPALRALAARHRITLA